MPKSLDELRKQDRPTIFESFSHAVGKVTDGKTTEQLESDLAAGQALLARLQSAMDDNRELRVSLSEAVIVQSGIDQEHADLVRQHGEVALIVAVLTVELENRRQTANPAER